jgi:redox-sensitive bicupin YhaK (pirin superfamily)
MPTSDGAGVRLSRIIGQPGLADLDPFVMLDRFHSDDPRAYNAGFPDHPHRGFETVSVMLAGYMRHRDSRGNAGLIAGGGG